MFNWANICKDIEKSGEGLYSALQIMENAICDFGEGSLMLRTKNEK